MTFDFDLLDAVEQETEDGFRDTASFLEVEPISAVSVASGYSSASTWRPSRARMWFEIKRFFEADARGAPNRTVHCARDLLLKTIHERLHRDGFVQIDSFLSKKTARDLSDDLMMLRGMQKASAAAVELHQSQGSHTASGWIGSKYLKADKALESNGQEQKTSQISPVNLSSINLATLFRGCEITFSAPSGELLAFEPRTKEEFLRSMKAFVHAAANGLSETCEAEKAQETEFGKVHAQFRFGNPGVIQPVT